MKYYSTKNGYNLLIISKNVTDCKYFIFVFNNKIIVTKNNQRWALTCTKVKIKLKS